MSNFIFFILLLFVLAALLRIDFFFTILYLFVGVYVVLRIWSRRTLQQLHVQRSLPERVFLGEHITVTLTLKNQSRLPIPWLLLNESFSTVLSSPPFFREVIALGSKAGHTLQYSLTARRRGYYRIGPLSFETGDLLGINQNLGRHQADHLIVYPKILPISKLGLPTHSPQAILPTNIPLFKDPARVIGVQNYLPGDNPRHIHWPASAATGSVLVKQFQTAIARENAIFLNLDQPDYGRSGQASVAIELAIVTAASLAHHITIIEDLPVGLITTAIDPLSQNQTGQESRQDFRIKPDRGRGHLMQILEILARVERNPDSIFLDRLRQEAVHLAWGTTIIIITSAESENLLQTALLLKRSGFQVTLVFVQPEAYAYASTKRGSELGISAFNIKREKDVEAWLAAA